MIYLTFDSNIWIYSLDESWQIENQLDYLEPWIQNSEVKILLPEIIISEWDKHEVEQTEERKKKLKEFFEMAEEILPSAFYSEYKQPAAQNNIIQTQLQRAKKIIAKAEIIPSYTEVKEKIIECGISKKAPLHKKSSVADALIVYSLIHFASLNPGNHYYFISKNTEDFYEKKDGKKEIHSHLKPDFDSLNIKAFSTLNELTRNLITFHGLKVDENIVQRRRERIKNKIKEKVYNPDYERLTSDRESSFILNINTIEFILQEKKPTKEQVIFVLALIDSDDAYEQEFYRKLSNSSWFNILRQKGTFNPENNPAPIQVKEGFEIPIWQPLLYLEKLSVQIKDGEEFELINDIINIINSVSEKPVDNNRTWSLFIRILVNLPNDKIPFTTLNFIPVWLSGRFNTISQSSGICEKLLPKFLSENPTVDDVLKAELVLKHLLAIEKNDKVQRGTFSNENESYHSRVHLHYLVHSLLDKKLIEKVAIFCSDHLITDLANNIKKLQFDFPNGINTSVKLKNIEYSIRADIENENLQISIYDKSIPDKVLGTKQLSNFESFNQKQTEEALITILSEFGVEYEQSEENDHSIEIFSNAVINGSYYSFTYDAISKLDKRYHHSDKVVEVFSLIFRDLLNEKIKQNTRGSVKRLKVFAFDNKYRHSFFRRIVLFVISQNWEVTKPVFWELIKDNDPSQIFSNHLVDTDLYELLNNIQMSLNERESGALLKIIELGPQQDERKSDIGYIDYWQLRWYSALRNKSPFTEHYERLSRIVNKTNEHYENLGVTRVRVGSVSPFSVEEILQKDNKEIVNFIHSFKPKDRWEEPTIGGLADALNRAVQDDPQKFSNEIELYRDIYYIYAYHIANGFKDAWKNKKSFNWENVLNFFYEYITSKNFTSDELKLPNDGWGATGERVIDAVANLLTEGMQSDNNAFDLELLPIAKAIIKSLVIKLKPVEDFANKGMDYSTYSLNSTAGKVLRSLLDYSLRRARSLKPENDTLRWEDDMKYLFEQTFENGIVDGYILTGMYFQQFYYLDKNWIINKIKKYYSLNDKEWLAFLNGFAFGNPPFNIEIYQLFYPHYERAIKNNVQIKNFHDNGLVRHIVAFYFWRYEDLESEGLLIMLLNNGTPSAILELVNFIWRQEDYLKNLDFSETKQFEDIILNLWAFIADKYKNSEDEEKQRILAVLTNLIVFAIELNETFTELIKKSADFTEKYFQTHYLIENLIKLKDRGQPDKTAKYIGEILNSVSFGPYNLSIEDKELTDLVIFLYENGQKKIADEFCDKLTRKGYEYLIHIFNRYKN